MRSRLFALAAACVLAAGALVGCGGSGTKESRSDIVSDDDEITEASKSDSVTDDDESTEESISDDVSNDDQSTGASESDSDTDDESTEASKSDDVSDDDESTEASESDNDTDEGGDKTEAGAKQAIEDCLACQVTKDSAETYYLLKWPRAIVEMYKEVDPDYYEVRKGYFNENVDESGTFRVKEFTDIEELSKDVLCGAEYYFIIVGKGVFGFDSELDNIEVEVSKGYKIRYVLEYDNIEGQLQTDDKCFAYVVWVNGDGWKVIDGNYIKTLEEYAEEYKSKNGT